MFSHILEMLEKKIYMKSNILYVRTTQNTEQVGLEWIDVLSISLPNNIVKNV